MGSRPVANGIRLIILALLGTLAFAQSGGQIVGAAQDASGGMFPDAAVTAVNQQTGLEFSARTDAAGRFSFPQLPVGNYRVRVTKAGFETFTSEAFRLDADQSRQAQAKLDVRGTTQSVVVGGQVSEVETVSGVLREVVDQK